MIEKLQLKKAFGDALAESGFTRKGNSWHKALSEVCHVVNLQKSDWSNDYYLNLAINIPEVSGCKVLPEHKCQIRFRAGRAFPDRQPSVHEILSLESSLEEGRHTDEVRGLGREVAVLMRGFESLVDLAHAFERGDFSGMWVTVAAQKFLVEQLE